MIYPSVFTSLNKQFRLQKSVIFVFSLFEGFLFWFDQWSAQINGENLDSSVVAGIVEPQASPSPLSFGKFMFAPSTPTETLIKTISSTKEGGSLYHTRSRVTDTKPGEHR